jgi:hypothetical protein
MTGVKAAPLLEAKDLNTKLVFDLVYNPIETPLIRMARQANIPIVTGIEMFVQQGARQFEIFTGKPAPEEEMIRVVLHALRQQSEATAEETPAPRPTSVKHAPAANLVPAAKPAPPAAKPAPTAAKPTPAAVTPAKAAKAPDAKRKKAS